MAKTAIIAMLLIAFSMCLAQSTEKSTIHDTITVHRVISDSVTIEALEKSQKFYDSSFKDIQGSYSNFLTRIAIIVASVGIIATIFSVFASMYFRKAKRYNEKVHEQLAEQQKSLDKLKEEIKKESSVEKIQKQFDTSFRFISRLHRRLAEDQLEEGNFLEYFYYMHIFYRCLIEIKSLNKYDLSRLNRTYALFLDKKTRKLNVKDKDNICWYIVHLLKFIKRCSLDNKLGEYSHVAGSIYKELFNNFISYDEIIKELENCMKRDGHKDAEIQEILELAKHYKEGNYRRLS